MSFLNSWCQIFTLHRILSFLQDGSKPTKQVATPLNDLLNISENDYFFSRHLDRYIWFISGTSIFYRDSLPRNANSRKECKLRAGCRFSLQLLLPICTDDNQYVLMIRNTRWKLRTLYAVLVEKHISWETS